MKFQKLSWSAGVMALLTLTAPALGQHGGAPNRNVPTREITIVDSDFWLSNYEERRLPLRTRLYVWNVRVNVESNAWGDAAGEVWVNGEKRGDVYAPQNKPDPSFFIPVERETGSIMIQAKPVNGTQGRLRVLKVTATVSDVQPDTDFPSGNLHPACGRCTELRMPFPTYYRTVMGNVSNQAIILVDRLAGYTNYGDLGQYLLPIKKAAAEARSLAEARGDASAYARPYYEKLQRALDAAEPYLDDLYERPAVFQLATELLSLREYIRKILD